MNKRKQILFAIVILNFSFLAIDALSAEKGEVASPWVSSPFVSQENPDTKVQGYQDRILELKNKRDSEITALINERDAKIQALLNEFKQALQEDVARIQEGKEYIQQQMRKGMDMTKAQALLQQEEQALTQKSLIMQQQVNSIKAVYDQQINNLTQVYAQQFAILQQQFKTGK